MIDFVMLMTTLMAAVAAPSHTPTRPTLDHVIGAEVTRAMTPNQVLTLLRAEYAGPADRAYLERLARGLASSPAAEGLKNVRRRGPSFEVTTANGRDFKLAFAPGAVLVNGRTIRLGLGLEPTLVQLRAALKKTFISRLFELGELVLPRANAADPLHRVRKVVEESTDAVMAGGEVVTAGLLRILLAVRDLASFDRKAYGVPPPPVLRWVSRLARICTEETAAVASIPFADSRTARVVEAMAHFPAFALVDADPSACPRNLVPQLAREWARAGEDGPLSPEDVTATCAMVMQLKTCARNYQAAGPRDGALPLVPASVPAGR